MKLELIPWNAAAPPSEAALRRWLADDGFRVMRWSDVALLDDAGFSLYEKRALVTLAEHGVADAATLCRAGSDILAPAWRAIPTS